MRYTQWPDERRQKVWQSILRHNGEVVGYQRGGIDIRLPVQWYDLARELEATGLRLQRAFWRRGRLYGQFQAG